jgi:Holliday junction resolvase RusA-like endonuclease
MNIPSAKYTAWHKDAMLQVINISKMYASITNLHIEIDFFAPDKRASDLSNKAESIMDLLVDAGIISDDNWWIVNRLVLNFRGVDKVNNGARVYIREYDK